jgi:prolyl-tRNA editing enzyme YbaK/EbsC (Cys-tRNA(Pro) deacylase)
MKKSDEDIMVCCNTTQHLDSSWLQRNIGKREKEMMSLQKFAQRFLEDVDEIIDSVL